MVYIVGSRPVLTFNPNLEKIFTTESLTMTCNVRSPASSDLSYIWYKDGTKIHTGQNFVIRFARRDNKNSGNYQCEGTNTGRSDPARLDVSHDWVILQAPLYVHEGDNVTLRCHHYPNYSSRRTIFYKDNSVINNWEYSSDLHIENINLKKYHLFKCTKEVYRELFTPPEIKVTPFPVTEGDNVTVTCHTNVSPYRPDTELQFVFYRDGQIVQRFSSSDQYGVQSAQLEDSGKYYCEVRTISGKIVKRSKELNIKINELFTPPEIKVTPFPVTEGDNVTVTCHTNVSPYRPDTELQFVFYRDGQIIQRFSSSDQYGVQSAQLEDSGTYYCEVRTISGKIVKRSKELNVKINEPFTEPEIIMISNAIQEGDNQTLTCQTKLSPFIPSTDLQFAFYRDGWNVQKYSLSHQYRVQSAKFEDSGNYLCHVRSSTKSITKRKLFTTPEIKVTPFPITEGDNVTVTCHTNVSPYRPDTELQFVFYRDNQILQPFSSSDQYGVQSAQLEDSGKYYCDVKKIGGKIVKRSKDWNIKINGK
uniref:Ig-like domain-containing protein n=1 Tax=Pyxicephalus adspersus TaxID=30357 RepID=A0AAV2ZJ44_PYXAD|nr:TPA: hypothetical protein GDO54_005023 [Pyxicephalus adspersus]